LCALYVLSISLPHCFSHVYMYFHSTNKWMDDETLALDSSGQRTNIKHLGGENVCNISKNVKSHVFGFKRKFELIAVQGHPRSMILVPIESAYATSY